MGWKSGSYGFKDFIMGMIPGGNRSRNPRYEHRIKIQQPAHGSQYIDEYDFPRLDRELQATRRERMQQTHQAQQDAYHQGLQYGQSAAMQHYQGGYGSGHKAGYSQGRHEGYSHGRRVGHRRGYDQDYDRGYDNRGQSAARAERQAYNRGWLQRDKFHQQNPGCYERDPRYPGQAKGIGRPPSRGWKPRPQAPPGPKMITWDYTGKPAPPGWHGFAETIYEGSVAGR